MGAAESDIAFADDPALLDDSGARRAGQARAADRAAISLGLLAGQDWEGKTPSTWISHEANDTAASAMLDRVAAAEQLIGWARAQQFQALVAMTRLPLWPAELSDTTARWNDWGDPGAELAEAEISAAMSWTRWQAGRRLSEALATTDPPRVSWLLETGVFDELQARAVTRAIGEHLTRGDDETLAHYRQRQHRLKTPSPRARPRPPPNRQAQ